LDFSKPFLASALTLLVKDPPKPPFALAAWFDPFTGDVWLLLLLSYVLTSILLYFYVNFSPLDSSQSFSFPDSLFLVSAGLWLRPLPSNFPQAWSSRLLCCSWSLFYLVTLGTYFLHLPQHLVVNKPVVRPSTVEQLLDTQDMVFGVSSGGSSEQLLMNSFNPLHQKIWEKISSDTSTSLVESYSKGFEMVMNGSFGMVMESLPSKHFTSQDCSLFTVGNLEDRHYAFAFPKGQRSGVPYRRMFSESLNKLAAVGKLSALRQKWWPGPQGCPQDLVSPPGLFPGSVNLGVEQMAAPLLFLLTALIISLFLAGIEVIFGKTANLLPKPLREKFQPDKSLLYYQNRQSIATQTVLWASSSRGATPARAVSPTASPPPLYHRIYNREGQLADV